MTLVVFSSWVSMISGGLSYFTCVKLPPRYDVSARTRDVRRDGVVRCVAQDANTTWVAIVLTMPLPEHCKNSQGDARRTVDNGKCVESSVASANISTDEYDKSPTNDIDNSKKGMSARR